MKSSTSLRSLRPFGRLPKRMSEIPITPYKQDILLGRVETVTVCDVSHHGTK